MAFGRNPHVTKAQAAEQKAAEAPDEASRVRALRDAAHQWDRAAERETQASRRAQYEANSARNRELADAGPAVASMAEPPSGPAPLIDPKLLN